MVESAVRLTERLRAGQLVKAADVNAYTAALSKLGLNPSDRSRLNFTPAPKTDTNDPWDAFERDFGK